MGSVSGQLIHITPVMYSDESGCSPTKWWEWVIAGGIAAGLVVGCFFTGGLLGAAFIGAAIGGGISLTMQAASGELNWGQFALDIGVGAITGMLGASGISQLGATFAGAGIGGLSNLTSQLIQGTSFSDIKWSQVLVGVAIGGIAGFLGGAGAKNVKAINNAKGVKEATAHYNKIAAKIANGNKSRRITHATKLLNAAIKDQKSQMFAWAMIWSGVSTFSSSIVYMLGNENDIWPF